MINAEPSAALLMSYPYLRRVRIRWPALIETHDASARHRRDMNKDVLAAALGLDEPVTLGQIEPFHGTCRHKLLQLNIAAAVV